MSEDPHFTISPHLLTLVETIAALRERIQGTVVELAWIPALHAKLSGTTPRANFDPTPRGLGSSACRATDF